DRLLKKFGETGLISQERMADALLQLMRWRYRFLVPSPEILKNLLDRFANHPPGQLLQEVAIYAHESMHDPGLHGGFEPTTPPTSMASRLHQSWCVAVAKFVMLVWADEQWTDDRARAVTTWAMRQLIPAAPTTIAPAVQGILLGLTPRFILSNAL